MGRKERKAALAGLRDVPAFAECTDEELEQIDRFMTELTLSPGTKLTREGEAGREFAIIIDGTARVTKDGQEVATIGPGSFVGEIALLDKTMRTATVTAVTPLRLFMLNAAEFHGLLETSRSLREKIERAAAQHRA
ncbi:MAG TPA: cyclic nucleotide-binding domain-containing protein [Actinomycetota bacterium]